MRKKIGYLDKNLIIQDYKNKLGVLNIAKKYGVSKWTIGRRLKKWGCIKEKSFCNELFFENIDSEEKAYWLGFLMADGCVCLNKKGTSYTLYLTLQEKDSLHLTKFLKSLKSNHLVHHYNFFSKKYNKFRPYAKIAISSRKMCEDLIKVGCTQRKSLTLSFPKKINPNLIHHLIRGFFDGDGSVYLTKSYPNNIYPSVYFIGTYDFLINIKKILNVSSNVRQKRGKNNKNPIFCLPISGRKKVASFYNKIYNNATIYLERKWNKFQGVL